MINENTLIELETLKRGFYNKTFYNSYLKTEFYEKTLINIFKLLEKEGILK